MDFLAPPRLHNADGQLRKVGFELEFAGVGLERSARLIARLFGGQATQRERFAWCVSGTRYGQFSVELDARLLQEGHYEVYAEKLGLNLDELKLRGPVEDLLAALAPVVVPYEIVTPPLPVTELACIGELRLALREAGALGTSSSVLYAFGLHINPEAASLAAADVLAVLRAFLLLQPWLMLAGQTDLSRRLAPYIRLFPSEYRSLVLDPDYAPDFPQLVADYLRHNPTRNRPLDLLPLLACREQVAVAAAMQEPDLLKARPAYHYRLPNCELDDPAWSVAAEWNRWVVLEQLAEHRDRLRQMSERFEALPESPWQSRERTWLKEVAQWLVGLEQPAP